MTNLIDAPETDVGAIKQVLLQSVNILALSLRSENCLETNGIAFVWQLVVKQEDDLLKTKNFGRKSLNEIKAALGEEDLSLGTHFTPDVRARLEALTIGAPAT